MLDEAKSKKRGVFCFCFCCGFSLLHFSLVFGFSVVKMAMGLNADGNDPKDQLKITTITKPNNVRERGENFRRNVLE